MPGCSRGGPAAHSSFAGDAALGVGGEEQKEVDFKHISEDEALSILKVWSTIAAAAAGGARQCRRKGCSASGLLPQCQTAGWHQHAWTAHRPWGLAAAPASCHSFASTSLPSLLPPSPAPSLLPCRQPTRV